MDKSFTIKILGPGVFQIDAFQFNPCKYPEIYRCPNDELFRCSNALGAGLAELLTKHPDKEIVCLAGIVGGFSETAATVSLIVVLK